MRLFIITASFWALVLAKPEMYREKEDFQYSRSSTDEGSKSGYYGAQRGNMGGNYEKAHNMDSLAQHQMSSVVGQVDGELGEGAKTRTGSVYTAGKSRGVFGSGNYDFSHLKGRNFAEGASFDDSLSLSQSSRNLDSGRSLYSSADDARRRSHQYQSTALDSQYRTAGSSSQYAQIEDQQAADRYRDSHNYEYGSQSGNAYDYSTGARLVHAVPVRIYGRPGTRVAIPVSAQTYDASQSSLSHDQSAITSDAELLSSNTNRFHYLPENKAKHYESAYSYRKEWEKHNTQPIVPTSTENPFPNNSELYEDAQSSLSTSNLYQGERDSTDSQSNSAYLRGYSDNTQSSSSSRLKYEAEEQSSGSSAASNSYAHSSGTSASSLGTSDAAANLNTLAEDISSRPKSYHHSYSYHKSWERRGDPYVIKPALDVSQQTSQRLTGANAKTYQCSYCVEDGQQRVRRSYNPDQYEQDTNAFNTQKELEQESMNGWGNSLGQQVNDQWGQLQDLGQQTQNQWGALEDLGQQTQNQWDRVEDLGQETQNRWDKLEVLGQSTQNQLGKLENSGQQTQNQWDKLEDLGQQPQNQLSKLEDLGQQSQNQWDKLEDLSQQSQNQIGKLEDLGQQTQNQWDKLEDLGQQTQKQWGNFENLGQEVQKQWINSEYLGQQQYNQQERNIEQQSWPGIMTDLEQQVQNTENFKKYNQIQYQNTDRFNSHTDWNQQQNNDNIFYDNKNYYNLWNSYSNFVHVPINSEKPQEKNLVDRQQFLWDKIDSAFKEDENNNNFEYNQHNTQDSQVSDKKFKDDSINDEWDFLFNPTSIHTNKQKNYTISSNSPHIQNNNNGHNTNSKVEDTLSYPGDMHKPQNKESDDISKSIDIGRGDIGPEDISLELSNKIKDKDGDEVKGMNQESQSKAIKEPLVLNVVGINQQGPQEINLSNLTTNIESITTSTIKPNNLMSTERTFFGNENASFTVKYDKERGSGQSLLKNDITQSLNNEQENFLKPEKHTIEQQKIQPFVDSSNKQKQWYQIETLDNQSMGHQSQNDEQQITNQQFKTYEHPNLTPEVLKQKNTNQLQTINAKNLGQELEAFDQKKLGQQLEAFEPQTMGQQLENFDQQNTGQQLESFEPQNMGQQLETFDQQNMGQQLETFEQQDNGQQLETFEAQTMGQQLENFDQQNMGQQLESFEPQNIGQQLETFDQQNMGQQLEPFEPQNNGQQLETFEPQNMGQRLETFEQQNEGQKLQFLDTGNINQLKSFENQQTGKEQMFEAINIGQLYSPEIVDHKPFEQENQNTMLDVGQQKYGQNILNQDMTDAQQSSQRAKQSLSKNENEVSIPIEPSTEKPGFWSSFWNKTKSAKDSVVSWFH